MSIIKNLITELSIIIILTIILYFINFEETVFFLKYNDIGHIIGGIGVLWLIGSFFRLSTSLEQKIWSIICSLSVAIFGITLSEYGFFYGIMSVGIVLAIVAYLASGICEETYKVTIAAGISLIMIGYFFSSCSSPTKIPPQPERDVDIKDARWMLLINYHEYGGNQRDTYDFTGTEAEAIQQIRVYRKEFEENHKIHKEQNKCYLMSCQLINADLPKWYWKKYGFPQKDLWEDVK